MNEIDIELLLPSRARRQRTLPRVDQATLDRVREHGLRIMNPVRARAMGNPADPNCRYEILQNLTTWVAANALQIRKVPVERIDVTEDVARELVLLEESQQRPSPVDIARSLAAQFKSGGLSKQTLGNRNGLSRTQVSHYLRLLRLHPTVLGLVDSGELSMGHTKVLVSLAPTDQIQLAKSAVLQRWPVREIEDRARRLGQNDSSVAPENAKGQDPNTKKLEENIAQQLGCGVEIQDGKLILNYFGDLEILQGILEMTGLVERQGAPENDRYEADDFYV